MQTAMQLRNTYAVACSFQCEYGYANKRNLRLMKLILFLKCKKSFFDLINVLFKYHGPRKRFIVDYNASLIFYIKIILHARYPQSKDSQSTDAIDPKHLAASSRDI